jgi:hypothetical protein
MDVSGCDTKFIARDHSLQSQVHSPAICLNDSHNLNLAKKFCSTLMLHGLRSWTKLKHHSSQRSSEVTAVLRR